MSDAPPQKPDDSLTPKRLAEISARLSDLTQRIAPDVPVVGTPTAAGDLPPLRAGFVRVVHKGAPEIEESIRAKGLDYSKQGMLSSTARSWGRESDVEYGSTDPRFTNATAYVFDVPASEHRQHENPATSPGVVPPKYFVGTVPAAASQQPRQSHIGQNIATQSPAASTLLPAPLQGIADKIADMQSRASALTSQPSEPTLSPRQRVIAKLGLRPPVDEPMPSDELAAEARVQELRRQRRAEGQHWGSLQPSQRRARQNIVTAEGGIPLDEPINQPVSDQSRPQSRNQGSVPPGAKPNISERISAVSANYGPLPDETYNQLLSMGYTHRKIDAMPRNMATAIARGHSSSSPHITTPGTNPVVAETKSPAEKLIQAADKLLDAAQVQKANADKAQETYRLLADNARKSEPTAKPTDGFQPDFPKQRESEAFEKSLFGKTPTAEQLQQRDRLRQESDEERRQWLIQQGASPSIIGGMGGRGGPPQKPPAGPPSDDANTYGFGESWKPPSADEIAKAKETERKTSVFEKVISPYKLRPWEPSPADKAKARYTTKGEEIKPLDPSQAENAPRSSQMPSALEPFFAMIPGGHRLRRLAHLFSGTSRGAQRDSLGATRTGRATRWGLRLFGKSNVGKKVLSGKYGQGAATVSRLAMRQISGMARTTAGRTVLGGTLGGLVGGPLGGIGGGLMGSGIGGAAGMAVGTTALGVGVVIGFTKAVLDAKDALAKFGDTVNEANRRFATYNGNIAAAFNRLDVGRLSREIDTGKATEGSSVAVAEWKNRFEQANQPLVNMGQTAKNTAAVTALAVATLIAKVVDNTAKISGIEDSAKEIEKLLAHLVGADPNAPDPTAVAAAKMLGVDLVKSNAPPVKTVREPVDWWKLFGPFIGAGQGVPAGRAFGDWVGKQLGPPVWNPQLDPARQEQEKKENGVRPPLEPVR